jgi:hypothetical protein
VPFFAFAPAIRKMIIRRTRSQRSIARLRKIIKTRGSFPNDDAALTLLYLAINNATCDGSEELHGQPRWGSLPFSSARVFLGQLADLGKRNVNLHRTFIHKRIEHSHGNI